jgi:hypothetical protein
MNYVFITAIESPTNADRSRGYKYSIESWKRWCGANGVELRVLSEPVCDMNRLKANYHRYYCFDLLADDADVDQVLLVDADTVVHPKCPNFFQLADGEFTVVKEDGDFDWVIRSIENLKHEFPNNFKKSFDIWRYFNSGFIITNKRHRYVFDQMLEFYWNNEEHVRKCQNKYGTGTDQPLLNWFIQENDINVKFLPYQFNMTSLQQKNILDNRFWFTKIHGIYHFNAINGGPTMVNQWLKNTFEYLYGTAN